MLQLLNPIWLFALFGIIVPLIIHLWNVKKGKTLKIGSIQLFGESSQQSARSLKLMDLLLLLLRCLLLILLALILAKPIWNGLYGEKSKSGWIIIEQEFSKEIYSNFKPEIDSLINLGHKIHYFEPEFKEINSSEITSSKTNAENKNSKSSYWSLLSLLNEKIPHNTEVFLFTGNRLNKLGSDRPEISFTLNWKTINPPDSLSSWIENAWLEDSGNIRAIIANSSPTKTSYTFEIIDPSIKNNRYILNFENGNTKLTLKDGESSSIIIDTSSIKIAVYQDKFKLDVKYLKAGIAAIQSFTKRKIEIADFKNQNIPVGFNIVFWLSEEQIPETIKAKNIIFSYAKGEISNKKSQLITNKSNLNSEVELFKRIKKNNNTKDEISIWEDGFDNPILNKVPKQNYSELHFYSRFNPEWNELVWSNDFPKVLIDIILSTKNKSHDLDKRKFSEEEMKPIFSTGKEKLNKDGGSTQINLENQFWLALILIFMAERYLSFKKNRND